MIQWNDQGFVLAVRPHGETGVVLTLLTAERGRHLGLVPGGRGRQHRGILQPGNQVEAWWRARLPEHLGTYRVEALHAHAAAMLDHPERLAALASACALCETLLPERHPQPATFAAFGVWLEGLGTEAWASIYVHWELALLRDLGYGLDLRTCAATGTQSDLIYVSPKSGRAVSAEAGKPYQDRLLALPRFLTQGGEGDRAGVLQGLMLSGYFLQRHCQTIPAARARLVERFREPESRTAAS